MEKVYQYLKRDISWLSFNYRVLMEAEDDTLPIYERIKFLSIYSSNMEEFYEIRVAEHRGVIMKKNYYVVRILSFLVLLILGFDVLDTVRFHVIEKKHVIDVFIQENELKTSMSNDDLFDSWMCDLENITC